MVQYTAFITHGWTGTAHVHMAVFLIVSPTFVLGKIGRSSMQTQFTSSGRSSLLRTSFTPGIFCASVLSIDNILAWSFGLKSSAMLSSSARLKVYIVDISTDYDRCMDITDIEFHGYLQLHNYPSFALTSERGHVISINGLSRCMVQSRHVSNRTPNSIIGVIRIRIFKDLRCFPGLIMNGSQGTGIHTPIAVFNASLHYLKIILVHSWCEPLVLARHSRQSRHSAAVIFIFAIISQSPEQQLCICLYWPISLPRDMQALCSICSGWAGLENSYTLQNNVKTVDWTYSLLFNLYAT